MRTRGKDKGRFRLRHLRVESGSIQCVSIPLESFMALLLIVFEVSSSRNIVNIAQLKSPKRFTVLALTP